MINLREFLFKEHRGASLAIVHTRKSFASWYAHFRSYSLISLPQIAAVTNYRLTSLEARRRS